MTVHIREATRSEACDFLAEIPAGDHAAFRLGRAAHMAFVAELDGILIGIATISFGNASVMPYLLSVYVHSEHQAKGVGTALTERAMRELVERCGSRTIVCDAISIAMHKTLAKLPPDLFDHLLELPTYLKQDEQFKQGS